uniref:Uncharacterized protein n=1 Tax=Rhizophora mucronata TaxID=61149 RepID=A0A2P2PP57_RHIMU
MTSFPFLCFLSLSKFSQRMNTPARRKFTQFIATGAATIILNLKTTNKAL